MSWIKGVLQDPFLFGSVHWCPEKIFSKENGNWIRCVDEPWTGDELWDAWVSVPAAIVSIFSII
jgi:hypothetical protein